MKAVRSVPRSSRCWTTHKVGSVWKGCW